MHLLRVALVLCCDFVRDVVVVGNAFAGSILEVMVLLARKYYYHDLDFAAIGLLSRHCDDPKDSAWEPRVGACHFLCETLEETVGAAALHPKGLDLYVDVEVAQG